MEKTPHAARALAWALILVLVTTGCLGDAQDKPDPGPIPAVKMVVAFPNLKFRRPLFLTSAGNDNSRLFVVEQPGRIYVFKNEANVEEKKLFLDISSRIPRRRHNEEGLLALAFHPKYKTNGFFYLCYSQHAADGKPRRGVIARFKVTKDPDKADPASTKVLLEVPEPRGNHNGCMLTFGDDGYLYASFGDGGKQGDPDGNGQNLGNLLGSCIRIDVDRQDKGKAYAIPKDNPFVGRKGARAEIWAYGLRNIWRMSFDRETGLLWGADVGQNGWEEVDIIVKGGNYGWNKREGKHAHRGGKKTDKMIDPVAEYDRAKGISITGGYVYRGKKLKELVGVYVYADYFTGRIWGLTYDVEKKKVIGNELMAHEQGKYIASFGEDAKKELYACCFDGRIYRFEIVKPSD